MNSIMKSVGMAATVASALIGMGAAANAAPTSVALPGVGPVIGPSTVGAEIDSTDGKTTVRVESRIGDTGTGRSGNATLIGPIVAHVEANHVSQHTLHNGLQNAAQHVNVNVCGDSVGVLGASVPVANPTECTAATIDTPSIGR